MLKQLIKQKNLIIMFGIIVIFLIFVKNKGFKKITERFENANLIDIINGIDIQDQKLNNMVSKIDTNTVTFDGTTKGGQIGDKVTLTDLATDVWAVHVEARCPAGSNVASMFSAA